MLAVLSGTGWVAGSITSGVAPRARDPANQQPDL
jgi:hypothetical protein